MGSGIGEAEARGAQTLGKFIPVMEVIEFARDFIITAYRDGSTLDDLSKKGEDHSLLTDFILTHRKLWEHTMIDVGYDELSGYPKKREQTRNIILNQSLTDVTGKTKLLGELLQSDFLINQRNIGKFDEVLTRMDEKISELRRGSIVHGDENFTNIRVTPEKEWFMIDLNSVSIRSPYESIAKILMWLEATTSNIESYQVLFSENDKKVVINFSSSLTENVLKAITICRRELVPFLDTKEEKSLIAAHIMTYFFRELQWLEKRGKKNLAPFLIVKALTFASSLEGKDFPYPLSLFPDVGSATVDY